MTKFKTDVTKGGYKILSIHGPDEFGCYAGVVEVKGVFLAIAWHSNGGAMDAHDNFNLIPLADEPKPEPRRDMAMETFEHALKEINQRLDDFDQRLAAEMKRNDELYQDAVSRVNGLRADYLADQSAVQPSRVDALEERLEALEKKNEKDDDRHESFKAMLRDWHAGYKDLGERVEALEQDAKNTDEWGESVNSDLSQLALQVRALEQFKQSMFTIREAVKPLGQPSETKVSEAAQALVDVIASQVDTSRNWKDVNLSLLVPGYLLEGVRPLFNKGPQTSDVGAGVKGVWVTRKALEMAFANGSRETRDSSIKKHDYDMWFTEMSRRLGL